MSTAYYVINTKFNRLWYPNLVGKVFASPPGFAQVELVQWQNAR